MKKLWQVLKVILILLGFLILWSLALNSYIPPENSYSFFELLSATVENFESENNTNMFYINFIYVLSIISFFSMEKKQKC